VTEQRVPPALEGLIRSVVGGVGDAEREQRASTFARGLALGALVGAAIAGSTIWQRRHDRRSQPPLGEEPAAAATPATRTGPETRSA